MDERTPLLETSQGYEEQVYSRPHTPYSEHWLSDSRTMHYSLSEERSRSRPTSRSSRETSLSEVVSEPSSPSRHLSQHQRPSLLCVDNVSYKINEMATKWYKGGACRRRERQILKNVSTTFKQGELTSILGNSGSGKTTLLDLVARRQAGGTVTGSIHLNGRVLSSAHVRELIAYVMQDDRLLQTLTVRETLTYTARLKFAYETRLTKKHLTDRINAVIGDMGLRGVADSRIGGMVRKTLSGGEKRRVSIALQLLQDPAVLLLDEPTTGLDSFSARRLVQTLGALAQSGRIVVLTVHQPRSDIFELLDQVIMLSQGKVAYAGPRKQIVNYFASRGFPCPRYCNPLDHCMDVVAIDRRSTQRQQDTESRVRLLLQQFSQSSQHERTLRRIQRAKDVPLPPPPPASRSCPAYVAGFFVALAMLYRRFLLTTARDRAALFFRTLQLAFFAGMLLMFMGRLNEDQRGVQDRTGLMFQSIAVPGFLGMLNAISLFPPLRDLFYREARDGLYSSTLFAFTYIIFLVPFAIFCTVSFSAVLYWGAGMQNDPTRFAIYCYGVWCCYMVGELLGLITMGFIYNTQIANSLVSMGVTTTALVATGLLRSIPSLPVFFRYLAWIMLPKYASELLVTNEYDGLTLDCPSATEPCLYPTGEDYLNDWFPDGIANKNRNLLAVGLYVLATALLCTLILSVKTKNLR